MRLESDRLVLRPWRDSDRAAYAAIATDAEVMRYFPHAITRAQADARIDAFQAQIVNDGFGFLAAEDKANGDFLGVIGIAPIGNTVRSAIRGCPEVEIGWCLTRAAWGKGLAPEGASACLAHAWDTLGINEIVAFTSALNAPSQRVMEKIGMKRDASADFEHPNVRHGHPLRPHVLYRIANPDRL